MDEDDDDDDDNVDVWESYISEEKIPKSLICLASQSLLNNHNKMHTIILFDSHPTPFQFPSRFNLLCQKSGLNFLVKRTQLTRAKSKFA